MSASVSINSPGCKRCSLTGLLVSSNAHDPRPDSVAVSSRVTPQTWHSFPQPFAITFNPYLRPCVIFVEVRPHHSAPSATALAESPRADPIQSRCSRLQVSARDGIVLPCLTSLQRPADLQGRETAAIHLLIIADCPSYTAVHRR